MNNAPLTPKKMALIAIIVVLVISMIAFIIIRNQQQSPNRMERTTDQDTGEIYTSYPNRSPETSGDSSATSVIIGGGTLLLDNGFTQDQYNLVATELKKISAERFSDKYARITFRPSDLKLEQNKLSTTIRLGDTDILLPISIKYYELTKVEIHINDRDNALGGDYDSGVLDAQPALTEEEYFD